MGERVHTRTFELEILLDDPLGDGSVRSLQAAHMAKSHRDSRVETSKLLGESSRISARAVRCPCK